MLRTLPLACLLLAAPALADTAPHADLEELYSAQRLEEGLALAKARLAEHPDDLALYAHVTRFLYEEGERHDRATRKVDKRALYEEMLGVVEAGLARYPDHPYLRFGEGLARARLATTKGVLASLSSAEQVEAAWTRAATSDYEYRSLGGEEQLPCDAKLALGVFYRLLPDWWIVKVVAGTRGDLDKSLRLLEDADRCAPERIRTLKELGVARLCAGQRHKDAALVASGEATLRHMLELKAAGSTEEIDLRHGRAILREPKRACSYSRDGQQKLEREDMPPVTTPAEEN